MQESKRILLTIDSIMKKMEKHKINFNHPLQRASEQWSKVMIGNLISDILQGNPIPDLVFAEQHINGAPTIWGIDGKQRCSNVQMFVNNKYRISDKIDRYIIAYPVQLFDEDGNPMKDEENNIVQEMHTCDIRKKRFKDLPKELQEIFLDYGFYIIQYLDCSEDNIAYNLKRYNEGRQMNPAQKGMTRLGVHFANIVKNISSMSFFEDAIGNYKPSQFKNGVINRVIVESLMTTCYLNKWTKDYAEVCEFVKKNATNEDFETLRGYVDRLEECVTEEVGKLFNAKDSFLWFGLFSKFIKLGLDDEKFVEFMSELGEGLATKTEDMSGLCVKEIDGVSFANLLENDSTKDKSVVQKRVEFLTELMCDYFGVEVPVEVEKCEDNEEISFEKCSEELQEYAMEFATDEIAAQTLVLVSDSPRNSFESDAVNETLKWIETQENKVEILKDCLFYKKHLNEIIEEDDINLPFYVYAVKYIYTHDLDIKVDEWLKNFITTAFVDFNDNDTTSNSTIMLKQSEIIKNIENYLKESEVNETI